MRFVIAVFAAFLPLLIVAQETKPIQGVHDGHPRTYALTNAQIHPDAYQVIDGGTLLVRGQQIIALGASLEIPADAIVIDLKGKHIYPSFVEPYSGYGVAVPKVNKALKKEHSALAWNQALHLEVKAANLFLPDSKKAQLLRKKGYGTVATHQKDGMARGTSAVVTLGHSGKEMIRAEAAAHFSFNKGTSKHRYPSSRMGGIALFRQTFYDLAWYKSMQGKVPVNLGLEALDRTLDLPQIFEVSSLQDALRADRIGDEFHQQFVIRGGGDTYQRLEQAKAMNATFLVPLNLPKAHILDDPFDGMDVSLKDLKHWELAPANAAMMAEAEIPFVFTADGVSKSKDLWYNLFQITQHGLSKEVAFDALTMGPARLLGVEDQVGSLAAGKLANFFVSEDSLFVKNFKVLSHWIRGERLDRDQQDLPDLAGTYNLNINTNLYQLEVSGKKNAWTGKVTLPGGQEQKTSIKKDGPLLGFSFHSTDDPYRGELALSGKINFDSGLWDGRALTPDGIWVPWSAIRSSKAKPKEKEEVPKTDSLILGSINYPFGAYGLNSLPEQEDLLITNTTIWTCTEAGVLQNADVLLSGGKIKAIGKDLSVGRETRVIDGSGKHLSPGVIDEHSHIGIFRGVNEGTQVISAEVRVSDVVHPGDINIYRQLAGGVTASQLLHGSSNPIGGQSALIKLKWGADDQEMLIDDTDGFIKFALGENVKRSNRRDRGGRFPYTRMGVEQMYYDAFHRAKAYEKKWTVYNQTSGKNTTVKEPRRDLELDALVEILNKKRFISCHSYVQSEINMLMHVGDSMGFRVNTFTHILEGYKVADKMKAHGAGGSTFSDWWAYKFEVNDAIPYNGALMHKEGVVTAFNSDDAEMGRRLNQEAAKAVKYGDVAPEEALKFVTLYPAKLLHLDDRTGSIEVGKDADVVLWSDAPLSIYAKAEKTIIEGVVYYDAERDARIRKEAALERNRIAQKMAKAITDGAPSKKPEPKKEFLYHCDTELEEDFQEP